MRAALIISLPLAVLPVAAMACSPGWTETPGPLERGAQCALVQPRQIGEDFAEAAMDLGQGRVAQVYGNGNGCDLYSSVIVTQCSSGERLTIGPDVSTAKGNGGGVLIDIKASLAPQGGLKLSDPLADLAGQAAKAGHDVNWIDAPWEAPRQVFSDWSFVTCACKTFYPDSAGAE